jgi:predicted acyltransferase (DUF342 family)
MYYTHILSYHRLENCSKALATESRKASALTIEVNTYVEKEKVSVENENKLQSQIRYTLYYSKLMPYCNTYSHHTSVDANNPCSSEACLEHHVAD